LFDDYTTSFVFQDQLNLVLRCDCLCKMSWRVHGFFPLMLACDDDLEDDVVCLVSFSPGRYSFIFTEGCGVLCIMEEGFKS
jgi:hypothetical protein